MSTITKNTSVTLNGSTSFKLGSDTYNWDNRFVFVVDAWAPNSDPVRTVTFTLTGQDWDAKMLSFGGNTKAIINDSTTGTDDDSRVYIDFISLANAGPNVVTLKNAEVGVVSGYASNDTVSIGAYADSVLLGRGDDNLTLTGAGEVGHANLARGNDTLTLGSGWLFSADMGRGNDTVKAGSGGFGYIGLGRDADTIKFAANATGGNVSGGEDISSDLAGAKDFDTVDFSAFTKALDINLATAMASGDGVYFEIFSFEKALGGSGKDTLTGSSDADVLDGGAGQDKFFGGSGGDRFVFQKGDTSASQSTADTIFDFSSADSIDLSGWDANSGKTGTQDFDFIGTKAFSGTAGELRYTKSTSDTWVAGDTDGDKDADFVIHLDDALSLSASSFDF